MTIDFVNAPNEGQMSPSERQLIYDTVLRVKPLISFESGTCRGGGSTYYIAEALHELGAGTLHTAEPNEEYFGDAKNLFENLKPYLKDIVKLHFGKTEDVFRSIITKMERIDFLLLDGPAIAAQTMREFNMFLPKMSSGSVLVLHDWDTAKCDETKMHLLSSEKWSELSNLKSSTGMSIWKLK